MAILIQTPLCATEYGNTGFGDCVKELKKIVGGIQVTKNFVITPEDLATLQTKMEDLTHAPIGTRIFPYYNWVLTADNTEDVTIATDAYGGKKRTRFGDYDMTFNNKIAGPDVHGNIERNGGAGKYFLLIDEDNTIIGRRVGDNFGPIFVDEFIVLPFRFATGDAPTAYNIRLLFGSNQLRRGNLGYITNEDFILSDTVQGLQDVKLTLVSQADNVFKVVAKTQFEGINMFSAYSTALAASAAWRLINQETKAAITITTVTTDAALDGGNGGFTVTGDSTIISALPAGKKMELKLAPPAALKVLTVTGFETPNPLVITKQA